MATHRELEGEEVVVGVRVKAKGNLHVRGVEGANVLAESDHDQSVVEYTDGVVYVECRENCVLHIPRHVQVEIEANGDLTIDNLTGSVDILYASGNVSVAGAGEVRAQEVRGDLRVAQVTSVNAEDVSGNAHINDVAGPVSVNVKGDTHLHRANGAVSINCKGNAHLSEVTGEQIRVNAKGDIHLHRCRGEIAVNAAGNVNLSEIVSQRVRAMAKGDIRVQFTKAVGGQAKIVTGGDLNVRSGEKMLRKGKGVYTFRFGQGDAVLALVSKGNTLLEGVEVAEGDLRGVNEDMGSLGAEMGAEMGAMGAEFGREFGNLGRDIARQVQDRVARKVQAKMREIGKRTAKVEWGEGKSWSFNFGDAPTPPKPPTPPTPPAWDAPFAAVEELATGEPVSEEERSLVLRMLEAGKISATEAATLLEALGDAE